MSDKKFELSRRNALIGLGTVGVASAGAGIGTSAFFSDQEEFNDNEIQAGELNLLVDWTASVDQDGADQPESTVTESGTMGGEGVEYTYDIDDAKPGDSGEITFCPTVESNPGFVWVDSEVRGGSLGEAISATLEYDDETEIASGTLDDVLDEVEGGAVLDNDNHEEVAAYDADMEGRCVTLSWVWPTGGPAGASDDNNDYQSDDVEFDVKFAAIQERHNDETYNPFEE